MKKLFFAILTIIFCNTVFAQTSEDLNRMIIHESSGNFKAYAIEKVDSITFRSVEGTVAAELELIESTLEKAVIKVTRTQACYGFKITCAPTITIKNYSDDVLATYIDRNSPDIYYQDFESAEMTGFEFQPNTDYTIATVGIDELGVLCDISKISFTTPSLPLVGNPQIDIEVTDVQLYEYTVKFTPNEDVSKFSVVAGEKGSLQAQFEMFAPMFGFGNIGQMIEMWGLPYTSEESVTWTQQAPNTDYEIYIQLWDAEGTMAPYLVYELSTLELGGEGTAEVAITLGDYVLADWYGEMLPSQFVTYTPNDQASCYRFGVYLAEIYDPEAEAIREELCSEPPMAMSGWYQYEEITTDYQINPNTECVIIAAAKNINGEWGPITELRFTTPADADAAYAPSKVIKKRHTANQNNRAGMIPNIKPTTKVQLINK